MCTRAPCLYTFQKHVLRVSATKIMTDRVHPAKAAAAVEICTQRTAERCAEHRQKVIVPIVALLPDIRPYVTSAAAMNYPTVRTRNSEKSEFQLDKVASLPAFNCNRYRYEAAM